MIVNIILMAVTVMICIKNYTKDDICNNDNIFNEKEHTMCTDDNDECNGIDNNENSNHNDEIM